MRARRWVRLTRKQRSVGQKKEGLSGNEEGRCIEGEVIVHSPL